MIEYRDLIPYRTVHINSNASNATSLPQVLTIRNKSSEKQHTVNGNLLVESVLYTGKSRKDLKSMKFSEVVDPMGEKKVELEVTFAEYHKKLLDQSAFNIACM